jgi:hypothetical protein
MRLKDFIARNRKRIDREIVGKTPGSKIDDGEREVWVMHCEALRQLAYQCGVRF